MRVVRGLDANKKRKVRRQGSVLQARPLMGWTAGCGGPALRPTAPRPTAPRPTAPLAVPHCSPPRPAPRRPLACPIPTRAHPREPHPPLPHAPGAPRWLCSFHPCSPVEHVQVHQFSAALEVEYNDRNDDSNPTHCPDCAPWLTRAAPCVRSSSRSRRPSSRRP